MDEAVPKKPKRKMPLARTMEALRKEGWIVGVTERWNPHARIRQDLFGFIDAIAMKPGCGVLAVQACAGSSLAAHRDKLNAEPRLRVWLESGGLVQIWAWRKVGARGCQKLWKPLVVDIGRETDASPLTILQAPQLP